MDAPSPVEEKTPLTYEETPPIESVPDDQSQKNPSDLFPAPTPPGRKSSVVTLLIVFILLFVIGIWLSGSIRTWVSSLMNKTGEPVSTEIGKTDTEESSGIAPALLTPAVWQQYPVLNGKTRTAYPGISFQLPPDVLPPICDGSACGSQGTYLPGGTRFTVALRGAGQVLPDFRGRVISDLKGIPFPVTEKMVNGLPATEFSGKFIGTTVGGYVFSDMRGFMIPLQDNVSFEINHFSPNGIVSDFVKDDYLFDEIVSTLVLPGGTVEKGGTTPLGTPSATPSVMQ